jgi:hypothetical protein
MRQTIRNASGNIKIVKELDCYKPRKANFIMSGSNRPALQRNRRNTL